MKDFLFKSSRIGFRRANLKDVDYMVSLEKKEGNLGLVLSQDPSSHLRQIEDKSYTILILESLDSRKKLGFIISKLDKNAQSLEFRRFVIDFKGHSYGREALTSFVDFAFKNLCINKLWLDVYSHNFKAIKLYQSINMHLDAILRESYYLKGHYLDQLIFSILKSEYKTLTLKC